MNVSFHPSAEYSFYAAFGKYAQLPALENFLNGSNYVQMSGQAAATSTDSYVQPLRSTHYEVGGTVNFWEAISFSAQVYYKSLFNQPAIQLAYDMQGNLIVIGYRTVQEEAIAQGLELSTKISFLNDASFIAHYALSDWELPEFSEDTNLRPAHRFVASLDYHSSANEPYFQDGIFSGVGFTMLFTAESGSPYTRIAGASNLGQATPWNIGARPFFDPRTRNPVEPLYNSSLPWIYYLDLKISAEVMIGPVKTEFYAAMLNILNTKNILNVYPQTGSPDNDGWLDSPVSDSFKSVPGYAAFYSAINLKNHWAFSQATGADMYGKPRELRVGMRVSI